MNGLVSRRDVSARHDDFHFAARVFLGCCLRSFVEEKTHNYCQKFVNKCWFLGRRPDNNNVPLLAQSPSCSIDFDPARTSYLPARTSTSTSSENMLNKIFLTNVKSAFCLLLSAAMARAVFLEQGVEQRTRKVVVSGAKYTDIDGLASSVGMAEFLRRTQDSIETAVAYVPKKAEWNDTIPDFLREELYNARALAGTQDLFSDEDDFAFRLPFDRLTIVDTSNPDFVDEWGHTPKIVVSKTENHPRPEATIEVDEVIDHHFQKSWIAAWSGYLEPQIVEVASCATLIAQRFFDHDLVPTTVSAKLLLAAIWSNSQDFQMLTTPLDRDMAAFLEKSLKMSRRELDALKKKLFVETSRKIIDDPVSSAIADTKQLKAGKVKAFPQTQITISQLEVMAMPRSLSPEEAEVGIFSGNRIVKTGSRGQEGSARTTSPFRRSRWAENKNT